MNFLIKKRLLNAGNPKGFWGIFTLKNMNNDHAKLVDAGLPYAQIQRNDVCLDIGCGGGYTLKRLSEQTDNKIYGIDISETSVKLSGKFNKKGVKEGRIIVKQGSASVIPFPDETFDVITAVETFYFWENKHKCLESIYNALKNGGRFLILLDDYDDGTNRQAEAVDLIKLELNKPEDIRKMLVEAGFKEIKISNINKKALCVIATKQ